MVISELAIFRITQLVFMHTVQHVISGRETKEICKSAFGDGEISPGYYRRDCVGKEGVGIESGGGRIKGYGIFKIYGKGIFTSP